MEFVKKDNNTIVKINSLVELQESKLNDLKVEEIVIEPWNKNHDWLIIKPMNGKKWRSILKLNLNMPDSLFTQDDAIAYYEDKRRYYEVLPLSMLVIKYIEFYYYSPDRAIISEYYDFDIKSLPEVIKAYNTTPEEKELSLRIYLRYIGEKEDQKAGKVIGGAVWFFAVLSVILAAVLLIFARPLAILMQAPEEALDLTVIYVRICGGGIFFIVAYNVISSIFRGMGNSRLPLIFVAIACGVNIVGDLFFVAILDMNVAGAALATVLAQAVSVVLSLAIIRRQKLPFTMTLKDIGINPEIWKFVKVGAPIAFQEILTQLSFLALCAFINRLGLEASSGYGVANKIVSFIGYFNGHSQTMFVMLQGLCQTFLVRLPVSYFMSIQENASLTWIGTAAPLATVFGIVLNTVYFIWYYRCVICRAGRK